MIKLAIEKDENENIMVVAYGQDEDFIERFLQFNISLFDYYNIYRKYGGIWNNETGYYEFNNYEDAGKVIDEIENYNSNFNKGKKHRKINIIEDSMGE